MYNTTGVVDRSNQQTHDKRKCTGFTTQKYCQPSHFVSNTWDDGQMLSRHIYDDKFPVCLRLHFKGKVETMKIIQCCKHRFFRFRITAKFLLLHNNVPLKSSIQPKRVNRLTYPGPLCCKSLTTQPPHSTLVPDLLYPPRNKSRKQSGNADLAQFSLLPNIFIVCHFSSLPLHLLPFCPSTAVNPLFSLIQYSQ